MGKFKYSWLQINNYLSFGKSKHLYLISVYKGKQHLKIECLGY